MQPTIVRKFAIHKTLILVFDDTRDMAYCMKQYAEHYENPVFMGTYPSSPAIDTWCMTEHNTPYHKMYSGFNFPTSVIRDWDKYRRSNAILREPWHVKLAQEVVDKGYTYLVAARSGDGGTLAHELAHAVYFMNYEYKQKVSKIIKRSVIYKYLPQLSKVGYDKKVWIDEANAYLASEGSLGDWVKVRPDDKAEIQKVALELMSLYSEYLALEMVS
jgi:hypothetical protein